MDNDIKYKFLVSCNAKLGMPPPKMLQPYKNNKPKVQHDTSLEPTSCNTQICALAKYLA